MKFYFYLSPLQHSLHSNLLHQLLLLEWQEILSMKWNQFKIQGKSEIDWNTLFIGKDGLMKMILGSQKEIYLILRKVSMTFMPYIPRLLDNF
jgi:hypothetical protein